ncbi:MAG: Bicarbonate transport ATP-binding protein CmpD [Verrucomicrobia subdivision 3 bacterium]|nr:Bicarbonate transport ATP-binding protein CmpD [Limisphaerales bacterium]MCS1415642.1 Bicarbonate transport ATP-binding protein CmpD [Limisphaerales bacterium]
MTDSITLECRNISHWFGSKKVLWDVNLKVERGHFLSLVGPSGCGKSTLLRAIVGTHLPNKGQMLMDLAHDSSEMIPIQGPGRDRGIVYQHYSLFPFLTAQENVALGLKLDQTSIFFRLFQYPKWRKLRREHLQLAAEYLEKVKLKDAMKLYPHEMSGGMRQRVAIAQALIMKPEIILLDEPFGALDEATREDLQRLLLHFYDQNREAKKKNGPPPYTLIIVTHELNEAIYVGDRLVGLSMYWDWKAAGESTCPGATVVYDRPSPVFNPHETREYEQFEHQRAEICQQVFNPEQLQPISEFVTYWDEQPRTDSNS